MPLSEKIIPLFHPFLWSTDLRLRRGIWNRIFCSPEHGFIYFRVPKSANSTISLTLARYMRGGIADADDQTGVRSKQLGNKFLKSGIVFQSQLDRTFSFTFVRNPFSRVLSAYLDKIASGDKRFFNMLGINGMQVSFGQFLGMLDGGALMANVHWAPQSSVIPVNPSRLDFVGRVESIHQDLPAVLNRIFGPGSHSIVRRTLRVTSATDRLLDYYGDREVRIVRRLYASDFELFYPDVADPVEAQRYRERQGSRAI